MWCFAVQVAAQAFGFKSSLRIKNAKNTYGTLLADKTRPLDKNVRWMYILHFFEFLNVLLSFNFGRKFLSTQMFAKCFAATVPNFYELPGH